MRPGRRKASPENRTAAHNARLLAGAVYAQPVTRPGHRGALVLLDRTKGGDWIDADGRWVVLHEPSGLNMEAETKALAMFLLRDAAHGEGAPFGELLPCTRCNEFPANPGEVCFRCAEEELVPATCKECGLEFQRARKDHARVECAACEAEVQAAAEEEETEDTRAAARISVNRYRKARTIADALLQNLPHANPAEGHPCTVAELVEFLRTRTDEEWAGVASDAGKGKPSHVTRALVLAILEDVARNEVTFTPEVVR